MCTIDRAHHSFDYERSGYSKRLNTQTIRLDMRWNLTRWRGLANAKTDIFVEWTSPKSSKLKYYCGKAKIATKFRRLNALIVVHVHIYKERKSDGAMDVSIFIRYSHFRSLSLCISSNHARIAEASDGFTYIRKRNYFLIILPRFFSVGYLILFFL